MASGISPPSDDRSRSTPGGESNEEDPELGDISVPAMSVVPVGSRASSSRDVRSRDRNATPPRRTPIVEEPDSDSTATPLVYSPQVPTPDPSRDMSAAAFVAGSALQRAHQASLIADQAANVALHEHRAADEARQRLGEVAAVAQQREQTFRQQATELTYQAQQAVERARAQTALAEQAAQHSQQEAQGHVQQVRQEAEGHVHLLRQEAVGHVERARHEAQQARLAAEAKVSRLRQEAIQEISSREQKILQQSKVIDTLGTENLLLSQRLADLERAVASMAQNVPVPPDESHESQNPTDPGSSGLNDVGSDLQVGSQAPQVQGPSDATREQCPPKDAALGASGSSSSNPKVAPRAPVGFPKSFAPPQPDIKSDAKRVQIQDGDPRAQPQGPPDVARTQDVRGPVDVQAQMSSLTELVHQLSKLVEAQVGVSGASPPIASAQAPPPSVAAQHTTAVPTLRLTSASTSQVAQFPSSPLAPSEASFRIR